MCFMGERKMSVSEGKVPRRSWNQLLPPVGATDELSWAEKSVQMPEASVILKHKGRITD